MTARSNSKKDEEVRSQKSLSKIPKEKRLMMYREMRGMGNLVSMRKLQRKSRSIIQGQKERSKSVKKLKSRNSVVN